MDVSALYTDIMSTLQPILVLSGFVALTLALITMLVNMLINAFTGKGFHIGLK